MSDTATSSAGTSLWSKHRVEALNDGIFAVAMTLLVIELKVPDPHTIASETDLVNALVALFPKALSWVISFFVLATFWMSHHRLFHHVRFVDPGLLWRDVLQLAFVCLIPFSAALVGELAPIPLAQQIYNGNMAALAIAGLWKLSYLRRHPALAAHPMAPGTYHATLLRTGGLIVAAIGAIVLAQVGYSMYATFTYLAMMPIGRYARHLESRKMPAPPPSPSGDTP